jgi:soluble lytic murein transglycosylase-like protein
MPNTAALLKVNPYNITQNIQGGLTYLKQQYDATGDWTQALRRYNGGPGVSASNNQATTYAKQYNLTGLNNSQTGVNPALSDTALKANAANPDKGSAPGNTTNALSTWLASKGFTTLAGLASGAGLILIIVVVILLIFSIQNLFKE